MLMRTVPIKYLRIVFVNRLVKKICITRFLRRIANSDHRVSVLSEPVVSAVEGSGRVESSPFRSLDYLFAPCR